MADKVYIPNLVVNEISEDLVDAVADKVGGKVTVDTSNLAKLDQGNTFTGENTFNIIPKSSGTPANDADLATKKYIDDIVDNKVSKTGPETIEGVKTFASIPLCQQRPTNGNQLANKDYVDSVVGSGDSIPLEISNQMATYDATTLNSVKYDFGNNTYSIFGTDETSFTTKTRTSGNLEKTADVIIGTAGAYTIPNDLLHHFGLSMKEMGQIPIGFSVTSNGNNIGGLGIGGTNDALVLWGGKTTAGTGANCISIQPSGISLIGQSVSGYGSVNIASGQIVLDTKVGVTIHLGNNGTISMDARAISEFKRLLGIS